jgi:hypothetical protein
MVVVPRSTRVEASGEGVDSEPGREGDGAGAFGKALPPLITSRRRFHEHAKYAQSVHRRGVRTRR